MDASEQRLVSVRHSYALNDSAEALVTAYELKRAAGVHVFPGVADTLRAFDTSLILGIVSSNSNDVIEWILKREGLWSYFALVEGRPKNPFDRDQLKPSPASLLRAANQMDCEPGSWYIGDDSIDIEAAHAAGMRAAGVATGRFSTTELRGFGADLVADTFAEVVRLIVLDRAAEQ